MNKFPFRLILFSLLLLFAGCSLKSSRSAYSSDSISVHQAIGDARGGFEKYAIPKVHSPVIVENPHGIDSEYYQLDESMVLEVAYSTLSEDKPIDSLFLIVIPSVRPGRIVDTWSELHRVDFFEDYYSLSFKYED